MPEKPLSSDELKELTLGLNKLARNLVVDLGPGSAGDLSGALPRGWQNLYHNAVAVLREVSDYELRVRLQDPYFGRRVRGVLKSFDEYMNDTATWCHKNAPSLREKPVAYFSAEFGFHETLPIAAGGLGSAGRRSRQIRQRRWAWALRASACFIARVISSRPLMRTTGRRNITIC